MQKSKSKSIRVETIRCHSFKALLFYVLLSIFILAYVLTLLFVDDDYLKLNNALQVLDKRQLDVILCNNAKHLMSAKKKNTMFYILLLNTKTEVGRRGVK